MASQTVKNALLSFFQVCTPSKQVLLFHAVQNITPAKGVPSLDTLRHISTGRITMPRTSRRVPVRDGTHDGDGEPPKSTSGTSKKMSLRTTKHTAPEGAASAKTCPVSTKSAKSMGNKIAGMPNKRGQQIVSSSTTRNSPQGRSPSQDLGIEDWSIAELLHSTRKAPPKTRASGDDMIGANRKPPPNTRASGDNVRGGATSKEQGDTGNEVVVVSPMAAAASTLLYQLQYGGDDGKYASDHSDASDDLCASLDDDKDYKPSGLVFLDDDDFLIDINYDSEDERL
jgi:hypothetical protein